MHKNPQFNDREELIQINYAVYCNLEEIHTSTYYASASNLINTARFELSNGSSRIHLSR